MKEHDEMIKSLNRMLNLVNLEIKYPYDSSHFIHLLNNKKLILQNLVEAKISLMLKMHCE
jgi:hypothetical protein